MNTLTIGFIGIGLIGGSIAKALKKKRPGIRTVAFNRSSAPLEHAVAEGIINEAAEIGEAFSACDFIFLCTPVEYNSLYLEKLKPFIKKGCIVTDVGSVKGYIHETVKNLDMEACFIGGHPMAGSEKTGYGNSSAALLEDAFYIVTPTALTTDDMLTRYTELVSLMGAVPVVLNPKQHDFCVAGISHVPHIVAAALVNLVNLCDNTEGTMKLLAAGGFKDITRIASSSPEVWEQICTTNSEAICALLQAYIDSLHHVKNIIKNNDSEALDRFFSEARDYRNSVADKRR